MGTNNRFYIVDIDRTYGKIISDIEKMTIIKALENSCGNQVVASKMLGLHRNTLRNKIKKLNIDARGFKR